MASAHSDRPASGDNRFGARGFLRHFHRASSKVAPAMIIQLPAGACPSGVSFLRGVARKFSPPGQALLAQVTVRALQCQTLMVTGPPGINSSSTRIPKMDFREETHFLLLARVGLVIMSKELP